MNDDDSLIAQLLDGDARTVETVRVWIRGAFGRYRARLASELEDLEQEILLDLTSALRTDRFRGRSSFKTFVQTCVHHKCIDRLRAQRRRQWVAIDDLDLRSRAPSALDDLASSEAIALAQSIADEMPESCRELWRMLEQGMSYREMSRELGTSEGSLRVRVLRCRKRAQEARERILSG